MSVSRDLSFGTPEYEDRLRKVQRLMGEKDLDALLCHTFTNICYLTGFETIASYVYFVLVVPRHGAPMLLGRDFELHNGLVSARIGELVPFEIRRDAVQATRDLLAARGFADKRLGIEQDSFSLRGDTLVRLKAALPEAEWVDAGGTVEQVKVIKSPAEIACIRRAAQLSTAGMRAALGTAGEGRTDNDVALAAYDVIIGGGGEYMCLDPIVTVGARSGIPHTTHRNVRIKRGDVVFVEIGACVRRYSAPTMRALVMGPPSDALGHAADAARECVTAVIGHMKPGSLASEVAARGKEKLAGLPSHIVWHGYYAYSIGLGFPPKWDDCPVSVEETDTTVLQPGMVFHASCSLRDVGKFGVTFGDTVLITPDGCEVLTGVPRELVVK